MTDTQHFLLLETSRACREQPLQTIDSGCVMTGVTFINN